MVGCVDGVPRRCGSEPPCVRPALPTLAARVTKPPASGRSRACRRCSPRRAPGGPRPSLPDRGPREGGRPSRSATCGARRSHGRRARPARRRSGRRGLVAAAELVRGRRAGGGDRPPGRGVEPDHHDLPRARGRLRLPPGAARACWSCPGWCAASITASWRARCGRRRRDSSTSSPCAPTPAAGPARARVARGRSRRRRCRRRRSARTTWRRSSTPPGTTADPKGVLHTPSTLGAVLHYHAQLFPPQPDDRQPAAVPAHAHRRHRDVRHAAAPLRLERRAAWTPSIRSWRST